MVLEQDHFVLKDWASTCGIGIFSTAFDLPSLEFLVKLDFKILKIPSGEITNLPLLENIGKLNKKILLSTGMSTLADIENAPKLLSGTGEDKIHLCVVMTSDRGLCGGFNTNIIKKAKLYFQKILDEGKTLKIITVGTKGYDQLKRVYGDNIIERISFKESKNVNYFDADKVGKTVIEKFENKEFDVCVIFYNQFKNVITQIPQEQQIIPLKTTDEEINSSDDNYEF